MTLPSYGIPQAHQDAQAVMDVAAGNHAALSQIYEDMTGPVLATLGNNDLALQSIGRTLKTRVNRAVATNQQRLAKIPQQQSGVPQYDVWLFVYVDGGGNGHQECYYQQTGLPPAHTGDTLLGTVDLATAQSMCANYGGANVSSPVPPGMPPASVPPVTPSGAPMTPAQLYTVWMTP